MTEVVRLTIPRSEPYHGVASLVVGGLAARLAFSYEHLEDVKLALDSFLSSEEYAAGPVLTIGRTESSCGPARSPRPSGATSSVTCPRPREWVSAGS